jgi:gliding-associated putative ABC transporter substrate-binding component GldG
MALKDLRVRYGSNVLVVTLAVAVALVLVNLFLVSRFARIDLTEEGQFSISEGTKHTLRSLPDIVSVKAYFSDNFPTEAQDAVRSLDDLLREFKAYGGRNLNVETIDFNPEKDTTEAEQARSLGIQAVELSLRGKFKAEKVVGYMGIAVFYGDKKEVIPFAQYGTLEYDLITRIRKLVYGRKTVGFYTGNGPHSIEDSSDPFGGRGGPAGDMAYLRQELEKQLNVLTVRDLETRPVPPDVNTLVVTAPEAPSAEAVYEIDQFILRGGSVFFMVDTLRDIYGGVMECREVASNLAPLVEHYGVRVNKDLVVEDLASGHAEQFPQPMRTIFGIMFQPIPYPFWSRVIPRELPNHPAIERLDFYSLPCPSSLTLVDVATNITVRTLGATSTGAWTQTRGPWRLHNPSIARSPDRPPGQSLLAVSLVGKFRSYFNRVAPPKSKPAPVLESTNTSALVVVGESDFATIRLYQEFAQNMPGSQNMIAQWLRQNFVFLANCIDWLNREKDLIELRSRLPKLRPLKEISEGWKTWVRIINTGLVPLLVVAAGLARFFLNRRRRKAFEEGAGEPSA